MLKTKNNNQVYLDGVPLQKISKLYGTPCYVYSKNSLINDFDISSKFFLVNDFLLPDPEIK